MIRKWLFPSLLTLLSLFPSAASAQDIGNVGLRTVNATLANGSTCTGSAQNFSTTSTALNNAGFRNLGQTSHVATATSNAAQFQMEIDGIDSLGNVFRISDLQLGVPTTAKGGIVVTAAGNFANIQVSVTCTAAATFSISYSGSFSPSPPNLAGALLTAVEKLPFQTAPANTTSSITFQTPSGNSAGTIIFQYSAAGPAGSSVTAQCITNGNTNLASFVFNLTTVSTPQLFTVTPGTCPFVTITYTSGGASAVTYNLEYAFNVAGTQATLSTPNTGPASSPPIMVASDALSQAFIAGSSATNPAATQELVNINANSGTRSLYFRSITITSTVATNIAVNFTTTTGATCTAVPLQNMKLSNSTASTAIANSNCGTHPTIQTNIITFPIAANTPVVFDLTGLIAAAGTTTGIDVTAPGAPVGTVFTFANWYEK